MSHSKISVVVLGRGAHLKKALTSLILGKDLSQLNKRNDPRNTETYENDAYVVTCTPDLDTACDDIRGVFQTNQHPDMSLLVVEDGVSTGEVQLQIGQLCSITGRAAAEFMVVLPLGHKHLDLIPCYTLTQLLSKLGQLAEDRQLMPTNKRYADYRESDTSTTHTPMEKTVIECKGGESERGGATCGKGPHHSAPSRKDSGPKVNLVLLGTAGTGKSASGNTILGKREFVSIISSSQVTTECQTAETVIGGRHVRVIDTPDMFNDEIQSSIKDKHLMKCRELCQQEPCVYLLVMRASRFTEDERGILKKMEKAFGKKVQEQTVVLFTRGEDLRCTNMTFNKFLHECQKDLMKIVERCDHRCVLFENNDARSPQVDMLMQIVDMMI